VGGSKATGGLVYEKMKEYKKMAEQLSIRVNFKKESQSNSDSKNRGLPQVSKDRAAVKKQTGENDESKRNNPSTKSHLVHRTKVG
jgi:hypothetical protein